MHLHQFNVCQNQSNGLYVKERISYPSQMPNQACSSQRCPKQVFMMNTLRFIPQKIRILSMRMMILQMKLQLHQRPPVVLHLLYIEGTKCCTFCCMMTFVLITITILNMKMSFVSYYQSRDTHKEALSRHYYDILNSGEIWIIVD